MSMNHASPFTRLQFAPSPSALDPALLQAPTKFRCASVWRHERPLLDVLIEEYGTVSLRDLTGTYGWCIRYSQQHKSEDLGIETLGELLDLFRQGSEQALPYLMHLSLHRNLPRLRRYFVDPPQFRPNWVAAPWADRIGGPELFVGQKGTGFGPVHIDHVSVHVGFYQLSGQKRFLLFPPDDGQYLYRYPGAEFPWQLRNSQVRGFDEGLHERYPLLRHASPREITLRAGEALFMPANWWHTTLNLSDSVSYSVRIVNRSNALSTLAEYARGVPRALSRAFAGDRRG
ncbi:MAG: cupin-like domain-containing protein [Gammaproteobacteria bacterium]